MGVRGHVGQTLPPMSHLHNQASSPLGYLYPWNVTRLAGKQRPLLAFSPQPQPHLSPGLPRRPALRYQQAHFKDKEPPLGPTNGIILGTTQKDRMGWGTGSCHPVLHQHSTQE